MEKLAKIQKELKAPKDMKNTFGGYNYRSAESILEAVKPLLDGAILTLEDDIMAVGTGDDVRFYIKATATFQDGEFIKTTTAFAREPLVKKGMDEPQITGTASSYARKYALNGLFCIDDNKDADTDEYPKSGLEDVIKGIKEKMTMNNWKSFYKKAILLYPKGTEEYKEWIEVFNTKKSELESNAVKQDLKNEAGFLNGDVDGDITEEYYD